MSARVLAAECHRAALETQSDAVISAIQFDYTFVGAIIGVIILVLVLLTDVEKYAPQFHEANAMKDQTTNNQ